MHTDMDLRNQIILDNMGKTVHVVVDRPIGYHHGDIVYPINYGYIPGLLAGDGEEQDAYILGVTEPVSYFDGRVVAAVRRKNDCEDKLVVAPAGKVYHQGEIAEAVHFQEQYFISTVDSLFRKSCGVIPYRWNGAQKEYLIVLQTNNCWSFPKGHMEAGETETQTALRELYEETGLTATLDTEARAVSEYDISPFTRKRVVLFTGEVRGGVIPQETEVVHYRWVKAGELKAYLHPDTYDACRALLHRKKVEKMIYPSKEVKLKNGTAAVLRSPTVADAAALLDYLRVTAEETDFLLRYPEECTMTVEQEEAYLHRSLQDPNTVMILCEVDGKIAGNCNLARHNKLKTRHRASIGIALMSEFWGLGIGTAMFEELICLAKQQGIEQLELEVFADNQRAMALYKKMGFRIAAEHPRAIRRKDGTYVSEYLMVREVV